MWHDEPGPTVHNPDTVTKRGVIGSSIVGSSLSILLQLAGVRWIGSLVPNLLPLRKLAIRLAAPAITHDPKWYDMQSRDLSATTMASFFSSIGSLRRTDLRPRLPEIKVPVMRLWRA